MTDLERIARAICFSVHDTPADHTLKHNGRPAWTEYEAEAAAALSVMGWQPIETAPKDGTVVDLWVVDRFGEGDRRPDCQWMDSGSKYVWWEANMRAVQLGGCAVTHWRFPPQGPESE